MQSMAAISQWAGRDSQGPKRSKIVLSSPFYSFHSSIEKERPDVAILFRFMTVSYSSFPPFFFYFYSHHLFYTTECNNKAMCVLPLPLAVPARTHPVTTLLSAPSFISFEKKERRRKKNECFAAVAVAAMPPGGRVASWRTWNLSFTCFLTAAGASSLAVVVIKLIKSWMNEWCSAPWIF